MLPESETCVVGLPQFSLALIREKSVLTVNGSAEDDRNSRRKMNFWGHGYHIVDVEAALSALTVSWRDIAGPFHENGTPAGSFDLSSLVEDPFPPVMLTRDGAYCRIDDGHVEVDLGGHSVVAVEVLLRFGEILAEASKDADLKAAWRECRRGTDLLPFETNVGFEYRPEGEMKEETEWYARKFGQSPEDYVRTAEWLTARQRLYGILGEGEDIPYQAWKPDALPEGLPGRDEVDALVRRAAEAEGIDPAELALQAVHDRNLEARQIAVYRRWYPLDKDGEAFSIEKGRAQAAEGDLHDMDDVLREIAETSSGHAP